MSVWRVERGDDVCLRKREINYTVKMDNELSYLAAKGVAKSGWEDCGC